MFNEKFYVANQILYCYLMVFIYTIRLYCFSMKLHILKGWIYLLKGFKN